MQDQTQSSRPGQNDSVGHIPALKSSVGHIPALDGLRGWAIIWVVIWHYIEFLRSWFPGWAGVDLFFVLSGYLITGRLIQTKGNPDYFSRFYRNRLLRIAPAYYAFLLCFFAAVYLFVKPDHLPTFSLYTQHWKSFFLFTQNWTLFRLGMPPDKSLVPLWSIAVEEQFYLFWPLVIYGLSVSATRIRKRQIWILAAAILLVLLTRTTFYFLTASGTLYFNTLFRMDSLLAGSGLYLLHFIGFRIPARLLRWTAVALLIALLTGCLLIKNMSPDNAFFATLGYTIIALLSTCLLHCTVQPGDGWLPRFFRAGFLRSCGKISFSLYLVHQPVYLALQPRIYHWGVIRWPLHSITIDIFSVTACLLISFGISLLSYRYFESWFLRLKDKNGVPKDKKSLHLRT
jgi:peptidoglycan/LPS O-acetylase OafA/YrhL